MRGDLYSTMKIYALESDETFDFNDPNHNPGVYRMGRLSNTINAPFSGTGIAYSNVLVIRKPDYDTLAMLVFPYSRDAIYYRTGGTGSWATQPWRELVTNANLSENPASFTIDRKNEINLCNGFSESNGIITLNYRGATAPIQKLRISNGRGASEDGVSLTTIEVADVIIGGVSVKSKLGI